MADKRQFTSPCSYFKANGECKHGNKCIGLNNLVAVVQSNNNNKNKYDWKRKKDLDYDNLNPIKQFHINHKISYLALTLFQRYDSDCNGEIDDKEFNNLIEDVMEFRDGEILEVDTLKAASIIYGDIIAKESIEKIEFAIFWKYLMSDPSPFDHKAIVPGLKNTVLAFAESLKLKPTTNKCLNFDYSIMSSVMKIFSHFDEDGDQSIDYKEFCVLIENLLNHRDGFAPANSSEIAFAIASDFNTTSGSTISFNEFVKAVLEDPSPFNHAITGPRGLRDTLLAFADLIEGQSFIPAPSSPHRSNEVHEKKGRNQESPYDLNDYGTFADSLFQYYDADHSGAIDSQEFVNLISDLLRLRDGVAPAHALDIARQIATSLRCVQHDPAVQSISFSDFLEAVVEYPSPFDHQITGINGLRQTLLKQGEELYISRGNSTRAYVETKTLNYAHIMFQRYDEDGSGSIDFKEFTKLLDDLFRERDGHSPPNIVEIAGDVASRFVADGKRSGAKVDEVSFGVFLSAVLTTPSPFDCQSTGPLGLKETLVKLAGRSLKVVEVKNHSDYIDSYIVNSATSIFQCYDEDFSGSIDSSEFTALVSDLFEVRDGFAPSNSNRIASAIAAGFTMEAGAKAIPLNTFIQAINLNPSPFDHSTTGIRGLKETLLQKVDMLIQMRQLKSQSTSKSFIPTYEWTPFSPWQQPLPFRGLEYSLEGNFARIPDPMVAQIKVPSMESSFQIYAKRTETINQLLEKLVEKWPAGEKPSVIALDLVNRDTFNVINKQVTVEDAGLFLVQDRLELTIDFSAGSSNQHAKTITQCLEAANSKIQQILDILPNSNLDDKTSLIVWEEFRKLSAKLQSSGDAHYFPFLANNVSH